MAESKLNKQTQDLVEANGGYIVKIIAANKAGTHDSLACIYGRFCSLEGKLPYNKMSPLQLAKRNDVIRAGGLAREIKSLADVRQIIMWAKTGYIQTVEEQDTQLKSFSL